MKGVPQGLNHVQISLKIIAQNISAMAVTSTVVPSSALRASPLSFLLKPPKITRRSASGARFHPRANETARPKTARRKTASPKTSHPSTGSPKDQKKKLDTLSASLAEVQDEFKTIFKRLNDSNVGAELISHSSALYMRSHVTRLSTRLRHIQMGCHLLRASKGDGTKEELLQLAEIEEELRECDFREKLSKRGVESLEFSKRPAKQQNVNHY